MQSRVFQSMNAKRSYNRRTDAERIAELEAQIQSLRERAAERQRPDGPLLKEVPKIAKRLRKFGEKCHQFGRADLANSVVAFVAGLERAAQMDPTSEPRRGRGSKDE